MDCLRLNTDTAGGDTHNAAPAAAGLRHICAGYGCVAHGGMGHTHPPRGDDHDGHVLVDQRQRAVLHLPGQHALAMDQRNLLDLHARRVQQSPLSSALNRPPATYLGAWR